MNSYYDPYTVYDDHRPPTIFHSQMAPHEFNYNQPISNVLNPFGAFAFDYNANQFIPKSYRSQQIIYPAAGNAYYPRHSPYLQLGDVNDNDDDEHMVGVVNGFQTDITDEPYQASLRYREQSFCGGSIISSKHCLTAGHCYRPASATNEYSVLVGTQDILNSNHKGVLAFVDNFIVHPFYRTTPHDTHLNDIAVLILRSKLPIDGIRIAKIALPNANAALPIGKMGTVSGWYR